MLAGNGPNREVIPVDVRQSMANGGGPACLRLRVVADPATVDPRFLLSPAKADQIEQVIAGTWPEQIDPADLVDARLRSEEHTSELQSLMRNSYAVFCLKKNKKTSNKDHTS